MITIECHLASAQHSYSASSDAQPCPPRTPRPFYLGPPPRKWNVLELRSWNFKSYLIDFSMEPELKKHCPSKPKKYR